MRRAAVKAVVFRARRMLIAMSLAALLVLALTLAAPVAAQDETTAQTVDETQAVKKDKDASSDEPEQSVQEGGPQTESDPDEQAGTQTTTRATDPLQEAEVTIESPGGTVERIEIAAAGCDIGKGATVTVDDGNSNPVTFVDGVVRGDDDVTANIEATQDQVVIDGFDAEDLGGFGAEGNEEGEVTDSTGITCGRDAGEAAADDAAADDATEDGTTEDDAKAADELQELRCDELLVLFRAEGSAQQYGDASGFADSDVRAQIEVCLEEEIVEGTAADGDLPDTGGLSLIGLVVLGVVSAAAGLSVIRGGRR